MGKQLNIYYKGGGLSPKGGMGNSDKEGPRARLGHHAKAKTHGPWSGHPKSVGLDPEPRLSTLRAWTRPDIVQILSEAKHRWLRPNEICEILRNYQNFEITPDPSYKPPGGSLFLFDRKALRYFRKDGYSWRKKKDGKTVQEAHEKLKVGSVDVLHCYYAHGEDNENFQRRSYWMLDAQLEHIVLVHYREVKEVSVLSFIHKLAALDKLPGNRFTASHVLNGDLGLWTESAQVSVALPLTQSSSLAFAIPASSASSPKSGDCNGRMSHSEFEDVDSGDELVTSALTDAICSRFETPCLHMHDLAGFSSFPRNFVDMGFGGITGGSSSVSHGNQSSSCNITDLQEQKISCQKTNGADLEHSKVKDTDILKDGYRDAYFQALGIDSQILSQKHQKFVNGVRADYNTYDTFTPRLEDNIFQLPKVHASPMLEHVLQKKTESHVMITGNNLSLGVENNIEEGSNHGESRELKKLDNFGRWMNKELGRDSDDSLMASISGSCWSALNSQNDVKEASGPSRQMQLDIDSLGPSLLQEQLFSIHDFSPDWAYSGVDTKVLISGVFLGDLKYPVNTKWCCMFGEVEVPAEGLSDGVLRCQAPLQKCGRVPFYITCSNRLACSEVREFEYREKPLGKMPSMALSALEDEIRLQIRFAKILCLGSDHKRLNCFVENCHKCILKDKIISLRSADESGWGQVEKRTIAFEENHESPREALMEKLLLDLLYEWLAIKVHEGDKGPQVWDNEGQGVLHLAAALGYEWALSLIIAAGVSPSFRDAQGRTGLHWAAYYGREEAVVTLVKLGAAPGAVDDPTSKFPGGQTAADLAYSRGHKGIAGYLAEAHLTRHLNSSTVKQNVLGGAAATIAAEEDVLTAEGKTNVSQDHGEDSQSSLKGSLAAVRRSAQAAAQIQAAFRVHSFRHRQLSKSNDQISEFSCDLVAAASLNNKTTKSSHYSYYLHSAAVQIQRKYRGWKARNEYLKIRNRIVRIQAHVRGHQVRKKYKKVVWSVGIVEKAILRWRRKGVGLRGFQSGKANEQAHHEVEKTDEYEFLRVGRKQKAAGVEKALARVQSMVRSPEAREQYMRLVTNYKKLKSDSENISNLVESQSSGEAVSDEKLMA
ncbi:hypothetical protein Sjap_007177 [Stephania japonica]|uniref:CG-1 domain-containing protein n=1 Tax=Stephania japonica TaxID=461633 RepID=A0AAP0P9S2_9MAGN